MKTLYAVIGNPIGHSMSPVMHNDLFSLYHIDASYLPFQVQEDDLQTAVKGLKALGVGGFNLTVPYKSKIIPFLDEVDELAASIGAVNTVVNDGGKLIGYNTDGVGFLRGLNVLMSSLKGKNVLIIGAGGAARAIYFTLAKENPQVIDITNRTITKAESLIEACPYPISSNAYSLDAAEKNLALYDVIIQTTLIGMSPKAFEQPLTLNGMKPGTIVCDIIYNPLETQFLQKARQNGGKTQNGIEMFVFQGALAFEKWTGIFPDVERMRETIFTQLGGQHVNR
nr:shikimate dehydrogenase [Neobacillus fumarioli]